MITTNLPAITGAISAALASSVWVAAFAGAMVLALLYGIKKIFDRVRALFVTKLGQAPFAARPVMNRVERDLYFRLLEAAPNGTTVLAQVQLSAFMDVRSLNNRDERWKYLNRIIRLSVDFLVVNTQTMVPIAGFELDGPTHVGAKSFTSGQLEADTRKDQAFKSAGIPLLRIPLNKNYGAKQLNEWIRQAARAS